MIDSPRGLDRGSATEALQTVKVSAMKCICMVSMSRAAGSERQEEVEHGVESRSCRVERSVSLSASDYRSSGSRRIITRID